jgi:four helix bundle protein
MAYGSLMEWATQILIAQRLGYNDEAQTQALLDKADHVGRLINGLAKSLSTKS